MVIDYRKLAVMLLPTFLRQALAMAIVRTFASPIQELHDKHLNESIRRVYELGHTGQCCHIKEALNKHFSIDSYADGFQLEDLDAEGNWIIAYDEDEAFENVMIFARNTNEIIVWDESNILPPTQTFKVLVPSCVDLSEENTAIINMIVNKYRLASRTFIIQKI